MLQPKRKILHFDAINQANEAMGFQGRSDLSDVHIYTVEETYPSTRKVMPPYTLRFYCVLLLENSHDAVVEINGERRSAVSDTISFQPPGHIAAWVRGEAQRGFLLYFQPEFLANHPILLSDEFPFFRATESNVLSLCGAEKASVCDHFVRLHQTFQRAHPYRYAMLQSLLLALLFDCKGLYEASCTSQAERSPKLSLALRFQQLLDQHYLTCQSVQAYAELLNVSPNHLSQAVSSTLGRTAYDLISDRLLLEAKKLLRTNDLSIAEVADYLGFSEPTHFSRFFKHKQTMTPLDYRRTASNLV